MSTLSLPSLSEVATCDARPISKSQADYRRSRQAAFKRPRQQPYVFADGSKFLPMCPPNSKLSFSLKRIYRERNTPVVVSSMAFSWRPPSRRLFRAFTSGPQQITLFCAVKYRLPRRSRPAPQRPWY